MKDKTLILSQLNKFRKRDFFSAEAWKARNLEPFPPPLPAILKEYFSAFACVLKHLVETNATHEELRADIVERMNSIGKSYFVNRDRQFIAEHFSEAAEIVDVDIRDDIRHWVSEAAGSRQLISDGSSWIEGGLRITAQPCTMCKLPLHTKTHSDNAGKPGDYWLVVRCSQCSELNLLDLGAASGGFGLVNCGFEDRLAKKEYTLEQALIKLQERSQSGN